MYTTIFPGKVRLDHSSYGIGGTLIISKFPIIRAGDIFASSNGFNRASYADPSDRTRYHSGY